MESIVFILGVERNNTKLQQVVLISEAFLSSVAV
jgi:hypothetical protein